MRRTPCSDHKTPLTPDLPDRRLPFAAMRALSSMPSTKIMLWRRCPDRDTRCCPFNL